MSESAVSDVAEDREKRCRQNRYCEAKALPPAFRDNDAEIIEEEKHAIGTAIERHQERG
jgi:hypothetical protein